MSHQILDNKSDAKYIESFIPGTDIDLNIISVGTQIYYLYKEENDSTILQWYWGCVVEVNKNKSNGEYYHIWHDDEDPWIDLSKDKNDWKQIPNTHSLYDTQFDIKDYLIMNNNKQTKKTPKKPKKKRRKSLKSAIVNTNSSDDNDCTYNPSDYEISTRGYVEFIRNNRITCTIIQSIELYEAVKLQRMDINNSYILWVRKQDIKQLLPNRKLCGQRISFELHGQTNRYKIIDTNKQKQFVQVYWKTDINNTWIHIKNFKTYSNKENKQNNIQNNKQNKCKNNININDGTSLKLLTLAKNTKKRKHKKRKSNKSKKASVSLSLSATSDRISDIARYKQLPRLTNSNNMTPQRQFLSDNTFPSPIYNSNINNINIGHKRPRDNDVFNLHTLPNKRQRLNNSNTNTFNALSLIAMQPPQPRVEMPALLASPSTPNKTPKNPMDKMPSPDDNQLMNTLQMNNINNGIVNKSINSFADDVSSQSSQSSQENNNNKGYINEDKMEEDVLDRSDTESQDTEPNIEIVSDNINRNKRPVLSEPPPYKYMHNGYNKYGNYMNGYNDTNRMGMCYPMLPMVSVDRITDKIMDKNISNKERIHSLKCIVKHLTNCQISMNEMWGRFGLQCKNVIKCVEAIINDLEQRC